MAEPKSPAEITDSMPIPTLPAVFTSRSIKGLAHLSEQLTLPLLGAALVDRPEPPSDPERDR